MELIRVVVIGAPQVGKSTIVKFVQSAAPGRPQCALSDGCPRHTYFPAVLLNSQLFAFRLHDVASVRRFPAGSEQEWSSCRALGLRSAAAYVLVFDLTCPESFRYIRTIRDQMLESRDMQRVPVIVVGNKRDKVAAHGARGCRDASATVRKHWKWPYVECSAKFNYRVLQVFRELTMALDALRQEEAPPTEAEAAARSEQAARCRHCTIQ
ncbi:ras-like protein family member 10B isoform X2 [Pollicipes pollicipes]|uniref:ras-like protein family member 10B isoform X2 n=1 Tax=Pollicipes pollicipes TaxID=41117 RepID=UPI0018853828|nr:ras-like protein family member 10B isoform X2 [Pollicipes pollicipes]